MTLGEQIRWRRRQLHLTQKQLGMDSGIDPTEISHIENGRRQPMVDKLPRLAVALRTSTDALLGHESAAGSEEQYVLSWDQSAQTGPETWQTFRRTVIVAKTDTIGEAVASLGKHALPVALSVAEPPGRE